MLVRPGWILEEDILSRFRISFPKTLRSSVLFTSFNWIHLLEGFYRLTTELKSWLLRQPERYRLVQVELVAFI